MAIYRKFGQEEIVEAIQWFKNGDHPDDQVTRHGRHLEGKVVRFYRNPWVRGDEKCEACRYPFHLHGWIDRFSDGLRVCPGDWVVTRCNGFGKFLRYEVIGFSQFRAAGYELADEAGKIATPVEVSHRHFPGYSIGMLEDLLVKANAKVTELTKELNEVANDSLKTFDERSELIKRVDTLESVLDDTYKQLFAVKAKMADPYHFCYWRTRALSLQDELDSLWAAVKQLRVKLDDEKIKKKESG